MSVDRLIEGYPGIDDDDLILCVEHGVAYQRDRNHIVQYDADYWNKCGGYENTEISKDLNKGRIGFVEKFYRGELLDIGIGCGEFIKNRPNTFGYDVNPVAVNWLVINGKYRDDLTNFYAFTFWDVLEHVETPENYFINMPHGAFLFTSVPIFEDLTRIRESKHYRPGEHLYYWTEEGLISWMAEHGFKLYGQDDYEIRAGRDSIYSYAFRKI